MNTSILQKLLNVGNVDIGKLLGLNGSNPANTLTMNPSNPTIPGLSPMAPQSSGSTLNYNPSNPTMSGLTPMSTTTKTPDVQVAQKQASYGTQTKMPNNTNPGNGGTNAQQNYMQNSVMQPQSNPNPPAPIQGTVPSNLADYGQNLSRLFNASAPVNTAQFQPYLDQVSQANQQYAVANTERQNSDMNFRKLLQGNSVTQDFFNNSQNERNRIYDYNLLGAGNAQQAANQTLQTQLALAQALRGQGVEQANVPFNASYSSPLGKQSLDTFFNLQQSFPDAGITYNPTLSPADNLAQAQALAAKTPKYQAQSTAVSYQTLPNGQTIAVNTKDPNFLNGNTNPQVMNSNVTNSYNFAVTAMKNLQDAFKGLGALQSTNIPAVNAVTNFGSTASGVGGQQTRAYLQAVQEARNAYTQLLAASKGGTPTEYTDQATIAIPNQPTQNDIDAALGNIQSLGQSRVNIYTGQGNGNLPNNTGSIQTKVGTVYTNW